MKNRGYQINRYKYSLFNDGSRNTISLIIYDSNFRYAFQRARAVQSILNFDSIQIGDEVNI